MSTPNNSPVDSHNHDPEHDHHYQHEGTHVHNQSGSGDADDHAGHNHGALAGHVHVTRTKLKSAFFATLLILAVELIGGAFANSLALLSDAGHVLTDVAALGLAWFAAVQAQKSPTLSKTYGYHRTGILAALANSLTLIMIAFVILYEAFQRFQNPQPVESTIMYLSAGVGMIINLAIAFGFRGGENNLNVRSALLHVLGDAAASAGVIIGAVIMQLAHWYVIDPIISVLIAFLIAWSAWKIVKETLHILMEGAPDNFEYDRLLAFVRTLPGTKDIHDLHVWSVTPERVALSCHLVVDPEASLEQCTELVKQLKQYLLKEFRISHTTIEIEIDQCGCTELLCPETLWESGKGV